MRRILLGGLGLALGVFTPPAFAQQPASTNPPAGRAATLGRPTAIPDPTARASAPTDPEVTPAGLLRGSPRPRVVHAPGRFGAPVPVAAQPGGAPAPSPMPTAPNGGMPMGQPMPQPKQPGTSIPPPRAVTPGQPMVTESRDPMGRVPNGVVVPSVSPEGYFCPEPSLDDPLCVPRLGFDRLGGLGADRNWISAELLLWWNRSTQVPPLVTTSSPQFNGILGRGDTQVLLGDTFGDTFHVGGRIGGGRWFDDGHCRGFDWRLFWVAPATENFSASVPPYSLLARPFFNVNPNVTLPNVGFGPSAEVVAGPGLATGTVSASMWSTVWGAEANYRRYLCGDGCLSRLDWLVGYRYLDLREELTVTETFARLPGSDISIGTPAVAGVVTDRFRTENHFHGGQFGLAGTLQRGRWSIDGRTTIALGTVFQSAEITGTQVLTLADGSQQAAAGGLLAIPGANIGRWTQNRFAVVPEVGVNLGYQLTSRMKLTFGYNFLYLSSAVRPGEVIDPRIDAARVPNLLPPGTAPVMPAQPMPRLSTSGYFIQGISFGLVYRW